MKYNRSKHIELVLKELLTHNFHSKELEWSWLEGYTLKYQDPKLYSQIVELFPEILKEK